jgi:hypothetical protein
MTKAGVLSRSLRLKPSAEGKRLVLANNGFSVIDGPFLESKELIGGFVLMDLSGLDEAIALTRNYVEVFGDAELEVDLRVVDADTDAV